MSFLTPLYLLAGLAILAPIFAHLVRKKPREVMDFSSVIFMDATNQRLTSRNRIDHWLLLLLRSLILLAVAFAFARPYLKTLVQKESTNQPAVKRVLLIDASASMQREGLWDQAIQKAKQYIMACSTQDMIAVYAVTDQVVTLHSLEESRDCAATERQSFAVNSLANLSTSWLASDLGKGMLHALDRIKQEDTEDEAGMNAEIAIVSDFQEGNSLESLGSIQWPSEVSVVPIVCKTDVPGNASIAVLTKSDDGLWTPSQNIERVAIRNSALSSTPKLSLRWLDSDGKRIPSESLEVVVPPGEQQIVQISLPTSSDPNANEALILELDGDNQPFDNRQFFYRGKQRNAKVWCIDSQKQEPKDSLWYFATNVPLSQPGLTVEWEVKNPSDAFPNVDPTDLQWVIASSSIDQRWAQGLKSMIEQGLHVLWVLDRLDPNDNGKQFEAIWKSWFPDDSIEISEGGSKKFHLFESIDMTHPVFTAFADPKFNDFTKIRFWHHRSIRGLTGTPWKVSAKFDDQDPAMLERSLGKGKVTVLAAGWQPSESQLALSSKFVPILVSMFQQASPSRPFTQFFCGDAIPAVPAGRFESPGIFSDSDAGEFLAVNIPRSESFTDPMELEQFARFGISLDQKIPADLKREESARKHQLAEQLESNQRGWWWILLTIILIAGLESIFAAIRSRIVATQAARL